MINKQKIKINCKILIISKIKFNKYMIKLMTFRNIKAKNVLKSSCDRGYQMKKQEEIAGRTRGICSFLRCAKKAWCGSHLQLKNEEN